MVKKAKRIRARARAPIAAVEPTVVLKDFWLVMAQQEPNDRRKRFLIALSTIVPDLTNNDMDEIEPVLEKAAGRKSINNAKIAFDKAHANG